LVVVRFDLATQNSCSARLTSAETVVENHFSNLWPNWAQTSKDFSIPWGKIRRMGGRFTRHHLRLCHGCGRVL